MHYSPRCSMVLVYKNLQNWVILFGQMLVNIPYMEHMGVVIIGFLDFVLSVVNCEFFNIQRTVYKYTISMGHVQ